MTRSQKYTCINILRVLRDSGAGTECCMDYACATPCSSLATLSRPLTSFPLRTTHRSFGLEMSTGRAARGPGRAVVWSINQSIY